MRNLKRALSLALSAAMLVGMMIVGTGAASYADVSSEHNTEAIDVLQAIGVMVGDGENFNPDQNVTREEMAVIMCQLLDYTVSSYQGLTRFTDVSDWARPYVEACYTNGIIAGYSDTQFGGADPVTTGQAGLMIMKALGYFQEMGDFGSDWLVATVSQGAQIELFDGVDKGANEALTRNDVAQMVLNALQSDCVRIASHDLVADGSDSFTTRAVYDGRPAVASWDTIEDADTGSGLQLGEELFEGDLYLTEVEDNFGRPSVEWTYESRTIGTYPVNDELKAVYSAKVTKDTMYDLVGSTVARNILNGGVDDPDLTVYLNGEPVVNPNPADYFERNATGGIPNSSNGVLTEVYMDNEDNVTVVQVYTYLVRATADYNATSERLNIEVVDIDSAAVPALPSVIDNEDVDVEDFKEDDYILVTYADNEIQSAQLAELVTGNVSEYTETEEVILDGSPYEYNTPVGEDVNGVEYTIGEDAVVVLDAYDYIIYVDQAVATSSYVYIRETATASNLGTRAIVSACFADGTFDEITIDRVYAAENRTLTTATAIADQNADLDGDGSGDSAPAVHGWYTFTVNSDDEYVLTTLDRDAATIGAGQTGEINSPGSQAEGTPGSVAWNFVDNSRVTFANDNGAPAQTVRGDEDTIFVLRDADGDVYTYTGVANVPTVTVPMTTNANDISSGAAKVNYALNRDGYATYVFIDVTSDAIVVEDVNDIADFLFLLEELTGNRTVVDGSTYYKYEVLLDGEIVERFLADQVLASGGNSQGDLYTNVKENDDGYITNANPVTTEGKKFEMPMADDTITHSGSSLTINWTDGGTERSRDFLVGSADINLIVGEGVTELLRDDDADYEAHLHISAATLAGMLNNYTVDGIAYAVVDEQGSEVATDIYVYVSHVTEVVAPQRPVIGKITVNGTPVTAYSSASAAAAAATTVANNSTVTIGATVTGASAVVDLDGGYAGGDFTLDFAGTSSFAVNVNGETVVARISATKSAGSATPVYVAVKVVTMHDLKVVNNDQDCAVEVTYNGKSTIIAADTSSAVTIGTVEENSQATVTFVTEDGRDIGAATVSGTGASGTPFNGRLNITVGTDDVTITFTDK